MSGQSLSILVVLDGKPGHTNQVLGLVEAIQRISDVSVKTVNISIGLSIFFKNMWRSKARPQLVIVAGHRTHKYALIMRFIFGAYTVVMMKPSLPQSLFNLRFIPKHDNVVESSNTITTQGAVNRIQFSPNLDLSRGMVLLGGISSHFVWSSEEVVAQIHTLFDIYPAVDWEIANSRRTPDDFDTVFHSHEISQSLINFEDVDSDWLPKQLNKVGHIWVTEDSVSMIFEALTAGARVGVLRLSDTKPSKVSQEIGRLLIEGSVIELSGLNAKDSNQNKVVALDEAARCADIVMKRMVDKGYMS